MYMQIKGVIPYGNRLVVVELFGHTSKGMSGLELVGLGGLGRTIKEKLIYISKYEQLKFPLLRFLICVELQEEIKEYRATQLRYLELPLLLLFWSLAGHLPISRLDDCFTQGCLTPTGDVTQLQWGGAEFKSLSSTAGATVERADKYIGISGEQLPDTFHHLPLPDLLSERQLNRRYLLERWQHTKRERLV
jgi:hypothetical protein